ncbi:MAG: hypothetical protein KGL31_02480 [candidate division NC10 bacterium]|nr:hypothetical protein [candidate division NC10 bacterium]MDE2320772.1 hypothetical protein [candidate division NC10 bacterium]
MSNELGNEMGNNRGRAGGFGEGKNEAEIMTIPAELGVDHRVTLNVAKTKRARRAGLDPSSLANLWMETLEEPTTDLPLIS